MPPRQSRFFLNLRVTRFKAVTDGQQALACARVYAPEVLCSILGLPIIDGYQVARQLRTTAQTRASLLIALTGYGQDVDRARSQDAASTGTW